MNTHRPGHAEVHATLEQVGNKDHVTVSVDGMGGDVILCIARLIQAIADNNGAPIPIVISLVARCIANNPVETVVNGCIMGGDKEGKGE